MDLSACPGHASGAERVLDVRAIVRSRGCCRRFDVVVHLVERDFPGTGHVVDHGVPSVRCSGFNDVRVGLVIVVGRPAHASRVHDEGAVRQAHRSLQMCVPTEQELLVGEVAQSMG